MVVEVVIDGGGGFDECRCGWVFFGVANRLWLLVVVGKREKERKRKRKRERNSKNNNN